MSVATIPDDVPLTARRALDEDIGSGDVTARLVPADETGEAVVISPAPLIELVPSRSPEAPFMIDDSVVFV